jgi:hypothetical protein
MLLLAPLNAVAMVLVAIEAIHDAGVPFIHLSDDKCAGD